MEELCIHTDSKTYPLYIGKGIRFSMEEFLEKCERKFSSILIISDTNVAPLYLEDVKESIKGYDKVCTYIVEGGEAAKSFENFYACQTCALENDLDRHSLVIALGGGVVGDLAGFVAATYMRGISFIQVPTTLLAHDSSVGGKVAINHPLGKNMIGSFYQPEAVIYDIDCIKSLSEKEKRSGYAEVIKHALIWDFDFYKWLLTNIHSLEELNENNLVYALKKGISVKAEVVSQDEKESGLRAILNFGHTLGHAIEAELGYGTVSHGEAVAIGMLFAIRVSEKYSDVKLGYHEIKEYLSKIGFPTISNELDRERLMHYMKKDKKVQNGKIRMVLMKEIGQVETVSLSDDFVDQLLLEEIKGAS